MSPRPYAGRGIGALPLAGKPPVKLPDAAKATLLPTPAEAIRAVKAAFLSLRGAVSAHDPQGHERPRYTVADVRAFANLVTLALRNDLPQIDPHDAAVLWEKWRKAIFDLRDLMRDVRNDEQALVIGAVLEHRVWDIESNLILALRTPRAVFEQYCPWRSEWATYARIHPEAV